MIGITVGYITAAVKCKLHATQLPLQSTYEIDEQKSLARPASNVHNQRIQSVHRKCHQNTNHCSCNASYQDYYDLIIFTTWHHARAVLAPCQDYCDLIIVTTTPCQGSTSSVSGLVWSNHIHYMTPGSTRSGPMCCVSHKTVWHQNNPLDRTGLWHRRIFPPVRCYGEILVLFSVTLSQNFGLGKCRHGTSIHGTRCKLIGQRYNVARCDKLCNCLQLNKLDNTCDSQRTSDWRHRPVYHTHNRRPISHKLFCEFCLQS